MRYLDYNKQELLEKINRISIERVGSTIITKYGDRIIKSANVSNRYEVFDIKKYLTDKIDMIEDNFNISKYCLFIKGGIQELRLLSDTIDVNGVEFQKAFLILNSSDKSRRLSFNAGLYCQSKNFYVVNSVRNIGLNKKHLKGITQKAEEATSGLNNETFDEQIISIKKLIGHRVKVSNLRKAIVGDGEVKSHHLKFDALKNYLTSYYNKDLSLSMEQKTLLRTPSQDMKITNDNDFYLDAFYVFNKYLYLYRQLDSHLIKNETEKILKITQWSIRNKQLAKLGL